MEPKASSSATIEDLRKLDKQIEKFREDASNYYNQMKDIEQQSKRLLDGMLRLNAEVMKLHVRTGDIERIVGLGSDDKSAAVLQDIVRDLRRSHRGIRDSQQNLKISLPLMTPAGGISRKGLLK
jgi:predicted  nucleic acid-binding Zn-ribbon protein